MPRIDWRYKGRAARKFNALPAMRRVRKPESEAVARPVTERPVEEKPKRRVTRKKDK